MKVFMYIVAASKNPDAVECKVPFKVNNLIFFGPCKKHLRENLYKHYLKDNNEREADISSENIYIIGLNGSNSQKVRKIIWVGKIQKVLTFEKAYIKLSSNQQFREMINCQESPLHLKPLYDKSGIFIGYELCSEMHKSNNDWVLDIMQKKNHPGVEIKNKSLILKNPYKRKEIFVRDCCFLCENIFYAEGKGLDVDKDIINILKKAQPNKTSISDYAPFGLRKNGSVDGLTGSYLEINGELAEDLIKLLEMKL